MLSNRVPARQVVDEILDVTGFLVTLSVLYGGRQRVANVLKLRDAAAAFDARGGGRLGDFVRHISEFEMTEARESEALTEDERAPVVRLMSIHNAKGLEFPIVVVADMGRKKNTQGTGRAVARIDHRIGISLPESSEDKTPYYTVVRRVEASRSEAEEMRVFYVAATRARDHLILSGAAGGRGGAAAAAAQGWAGAALAALSLDLSSPGSIDLDGMTLEYSCPKEPLGPGRRGVKPPILHWRDRLLAGKFLPKASHPLQRQVLARCAKIGGSAKSGDRFVATELADFSRCPLQYELRHLRGLPPDYRLADPVGKDAAPPAHLVGTLLHAVLERARRFDSLSSVLEKLLATDMSYTGWAAGLRRECLPILKRFEASPFFQRMRAADCEREKGFSFLLEGFLIEGTMDLFMKGQVVDFKSDDVTAQEAPAHAQEYRSQMDVYALAYERLTGAPPDRVVLYFLRPELEVSWDYGPKETAAAQKRVLGTIRTILAGPPFAAARENAKCHCEYQSLCAFIRDRRSAHTAEA
jgi:ATP-dependent helicase/nuclease subunit A